MHDVMRDSIASTLSVQEQRVKGPKKSAVESSIAKEPPDGGVSAWLQVFGGFFLFFNSWGLANTFGVFQTFYRTELIPQVPNSTISWTGSLTTFLILASPIVWGPLYDLGYLRTLVILGNSLVVFGIMMTSLCTQFWQLILAQGVVIGLGGGCMHISAVSIIPSYFTTRRAIAVGVAQMGAGLAGVIYPIIFNQLQPQIGFGWTVRVIGFVVLATGLIPCIVVRPRTKPAGKMRRLFDSAILKDPSFETFNAACFFGFMTQYIPFFYIQQYAASHGFDTSLSFYMLTIMNVGSIFGRVVPGFVADRLLSPVSTLAVCTICACILCFGWIGIQTSTPGLVIFSILYGFFSGAFVGLPTPSIAKMTTDFSKIGTKFGINAFFSSLGALIGSPVAGAIEPKSWTGLQAFAGTALAIAACLMMLTKAVYERANDSREDKKDGGGE